MTISEEIGQPPRVDFDDISNPEIMAFVAYWESLKGDAFAPSWKDFDLAALDPKSIPYIIVIDVVRDPLDFVIRFWGTGHVAKKGVDKTGKSVGDAPRFRKDTALNRVPLDNKREKNAGIPQYGQFTGTQGDHAVRTEPRPLALIR